MVGRVRPEELGKLGLRSAADPVGWLQLRPMDPSAELPGLSCPSAGVRGESSLRVRLFRRLGVQVGFFSRLLVPRSVRRAMHPGRAVKRAVTPRAVKRASQALHPIDNAVYSVQRSAATAIRSGGKRKAPVFRHGNCPVHHRSAEAAAKCRNP